MNLQIYLAGQIHDPWQKTFAKHCRDKELSVDLFGPMEDHDLSDHIGEQIIGKQPTSILKDESASSINNLRTKILMNKADVVVAYFGDAYRQWNTAQDCGTAISLNKPLILVRDPSLHHALKEISNDAQVTVDTLEQATDVLSYVLQPNGYTAK
ncbi:YtoQ family protein [Bacillaceae bacterium SIJ1]|uniref:YtoQ family protein n=1 Tax=Litoribacterium kuwaitense TaxID=1398745 RepID=UPI0013EA6207|nr:YtoQ family protein [Litoribacterium kuwaitense]NGP44209.1 YtoQ family protein [Litoribacterium kuwaitense]